MIKNKLRMFALAGIISVSAFTPVNALAKEIKIDYKDVSADDIVITEAEGGMFEEGRVIILAVEKIEVYGDVICSVTEGDIEVSAEITDKEGILKLYNKSTDIEKIKKTLLDDCSYLVITVEDDSTEASKIVVSGLKLYADRTIPNGGYALTNIYAVNGMWENSSADKGEYEKNGIFKYEEMEVSPSYVQVVTSPRDKDDSTLNRKINITIGAEQIQVGTDIIALDVPAYINKDGYAMLPLRAIAEALGTRVEWNEEAKSVAIFSGKRIVSMVVGERTMYINGTPVAMNTAPEICSERTFIPIRDFANAMGIKDIVFDEEKYMVLLN